MNYHAHFPLAMQLCLRVTCIMISSLKSDTCHGWVLGTGKGEETEHKMERINKESFRKFTSWVISEPLEQVSKTHQMHA